MLKHFQLHAFFIHLIKQRVIDSLVDAVGHSVVGLHQGPDFRFLDVGRNLKQAQMSLPCQADIEQHPIC